MATGVAIALAAVLAAAPGSTAADPTAPPTAGVEVEIPGPEHGTLAGSGHTHVPPGSRNQPASRLTATEAVADGEVAKVVDNGPIADRLDIVVVGDGYTVADDRRIDNLADILVAEEGPGILNWLIDGARRYLAGEKDLTGPDKVRIATKAYAYAETEDHTGRFFDEACLLNPDARTEQKTLYDAYCGWCQSEGCIPMSNRTFAARARELLGLASPKEMILSNSRKYYPGIGLLAHEETA